PYFYTLSLHDALPIYQPSIFRQQKRIDFQQRRIHRFVGRVKRLHELGGLRNQIGREPQRKRKLARLKGTKPDGRIDRRVSSLSGDRKSTRLNSSHVKI